MSFSKVLRREPHSLRLLRSAEEAMRVPGAQSASLLHV